MVLQARQKCRDLDDLHKAFGMHYAMHGYPVERLMRGALDMQTSHEAIVL